MAKTGNTVHFNPEGMGGIVRKVGLTLVLLVLACVLGSASPGIFSADRKSTRLNSSH